MSKYFNSYTNTGRRNCSILTLSVTAARSQEIIGSYGSQF
uniref:Uncharacterized protein n=1 Tax=Tetranychus urticae TaxID=32264 RepID=T1KWN7_TETUR